MRVFITVLAILFNAGCSTHPLLHPVQTVSLNKNSPLHIASTKTFISVSTLDRLNDTASINPSAAPAGSGAAFGFLGVLVAAGLVYNDNNVRMRKERLRTPLRGYLLKKNIAGMLKNRLHATLGNTAWLKHRYITKTIKPTIPRKHQLVRKAGDSHFLFIDIYPTLATQGNGLTWVVIIEFMELINGQEQGAIKSNVIYRNRFLLDYVFPDGGNKNQTPDTGSTTAHLPLPKTIDDAVDFLISELVYFVDLDMLQTNPDKRDWRKISIPPGPGYRIPRKNGHFSVFTENREFYSTNVKPVTP